MFVGNVKNFDIISSKFTRRRGFVNIKSSKKYSHKKAISILNSFTPQGASPKISLRIGKFEDMMGAGYYYMQDQETACISTVLIKMEDIMPNRIRLPFGETTIKHVAQGKHNYFFKYDIEDEYNFIESFGYEQFGSIIYSLLTGDNLIIVHPSHESRIKFIRSLFYLLPIQSFHYNRITTGCSELDGNENIVGVPELPMKYRSHKKLHLPLDTIFVDLVDNRIQGEGIKNCEFTRSIGKLYENNKAEAIHHIQNFLSKIINRQPLAQSTRSDQKTELLIHQIKHKMGLVDDNREEFMMAF